MTPPSHPAKGSSLAVLCGAGLFLCTTSIVLRLWSRATRPKGAKFGVDDWAALVAWAFVFAELIINSAGKRAGLGDVVRSLHNQYGEFYIYNMGMAFVRLAALLFYRREFKRTHKTLNYLILGTISFTLIWVVAFNLGRTFSCSPVEAFWDRTIPQYHCQPTLDQQWAVGITSAIVDVWILILPLPYVWRMQTTFMFGFFIVCSAVGFVISAVVTGALLEMDLTRDFANPSYLYVCEEIVALCLVSLPCILDLGRRVKRNGFQSALTDSTYNDPQRPTTREKEDINGK